MYGDHYTEMCLPAAKSPKRLLLRLRTSFFRLRDAIIRGIQKKNARGAIIRGIQKTYKKKRKNYAPTCVGAKMHTWVPCSVRAKMHTCVDVYTHPREGVNVRRGVDVYTHPREGLNVRRGVGMMRRSPVFMGPLPN